MTTRAQLRGSLRERLEDASGSPLWQDAALNDFLAAAVRAYGVAFPRPANGATAAVALGAVSVALPAGVGEGAIVAVRDGHGRDVARWFGHPGPAPADATGLAQAWRAWAGALRLDRPTRGDEVGAWSVDYLAGRELVGDDVTPQPIEAGDEPIVVSLALAQALDRRAVEDAKRGTSAQRAPAGISSLAKDAREEAARLIAARKRRARGGVLVLA